LIYLQNKEFIDHHLNNAGNVINEQTSQFRDIAAQQASHAAEMTKSTANQLSARAQELMGQAQNRAAQPDVANPGNLNPAKDEPERDLRNTTAADLPNPGNLNPARNEPERNVSNQARDMSNNISGSDFPSAPKTSFEHGGLSSTEPHAQHSGEPMPSL